MTGCRNMVDPLRSVLVAHPGDHWFDQSFIDRNWRLDGFLAAPDFLGACREFDALVSVLDDYGVDIKLLPTSDGATLDAVYVHDPSVITPSGDIILCRMGKVTRRDEIQLTRNVCEQSGISIQGIIQPPGLLEGGDIVWLDEETVAVGSGYRSNRAGISMLAKILGQGIKVIPVPLPHFRGPGDVLHLMSAISPLDPSTFVVHKPLLPVEFIAFLDSRDYRLIEIDADEYDTLACNILALDHNVCIMAGENPRTRKKIESAGFEVVAINGDDLCIKGQGGPTCLTRPLWRSM